MIDLLTILTQIDDFMYFPVLIIVMAAAGLYFTFTTKGVQIRLAVESVRLILEPKEDQNSVSSLQAMLVSTASRVGTGNIIGVSTAICLGGPGACFWMWIMCIIGASSAFMESTLAQIYKRKDNNGQAYGGPAYYIEKGLKQHKLAILFCICLIATYALGFNLLCSYNLQSTFMDYSFYNPAVTPLIIGGILAVITGYCLMGGGKRIIKVTGTVVPIMGVAYVAVALIVILINYQNIPPMFLLIFQDAFDFKSIAGGIVGSCLVYGIKRGLFSNEAGVGSAPNASASAKVSHPAKQGLVQTLSVYIDTLILCTATALMCLSTGVARDAAVSGAPYVQNAISTVFGTAGPVFITVAMVLFAFTTLLGNIYYVDNALTFMNNKVKPSKRFMNIFYIACTVVIFVGAIIPMDAAWAMADITMGAMTLINLPTCMILGKHAIACLKDYEIQKKAGKNPIFKASSIDINEEDLDFWK
ncbi:sodium:alanine symporter family protein [Methanobrevibacter millerae]|uniref:Amino acid carrier protein AGCS family n=1 Tax=Methanobrevibacter millerae TaxID=230361 RepID=A0A0U3DSV8_9EURY|nr:alanine/glycine:cation symporter family protein [Methanobrevibacter millerae]ALT69018.1 amino acid carrier protein AGCS family [Methanobrevibacter millerae]